MVEGLASEIFLPQPVPIKLSIRQTNRQAIGSDWSPRPELSSYMVKFAILIQLVESFPVNFSCSHMFVLIVGRWHICLLRLPSAPQRYVFFRTFLPLRSLILHLPSVKLSTTGVWSISVHLWSLSCPPEPLVVVFDRWLRSHWMFDVDMRTVPITQLHILNLKYY